MRTSEQTDKIVQAILSANRDMTAISKGGRNDFDKYDYARLEDYIRSISPTLLANGLFVSSSVTNHEPIADGRITSKDKKENGCMVRIAVRMFHESGQWIEIDSVGEGQDRADKSSYKAITGARKYGLAMLLNLVTTDDPEADHKVGIGDDPDTNKHGQQRASAPRAQATESFE